METPGESSIMVVLACKSFIDPEVLRRQRAEETHTCVYGENACRAIPEPS